LAPVAPSSFSSQQPRAPSGCDDYVFVKRGGGGGGVNCRRCRKEVEEEELVQYNWYVTIQAIAQ
jgi:hypothetical protein